MTLLDKITEKVLAQIDDTGFTQSGAFNLRHNGIALCHGDSEHITVSYTHLTLPTTPYV